MQNQEIPAEQWGPFFDHVSRRHEGESISIETQGALAADTGAQSRASGVRLISIKFDPQIGDNDQIDVIVSDASNAQLMHAIAHPAHVRISRTDDGFDTTLRVESREGQATLVRFHSHSKQGASAEDEGNPT
ncbi:MAG TPA: DUF5335 family protein [Tepidisphaeraceae bacterium]|jgi:hypothetical protein